MNYHNYQFYLVVAGIIALAVDHCAFHEEGTLCET